MEKIKKSAYSKFDDERSVAKSILPKVEGRLLLNRILMILLYVVYLGVFTAILARINPYMIALSVVTVCILIFFTWRYVNIEYELTIHEAKLGFATIYGGLSRKELFSCRVRDLKVIAPYTGAEDTSDTFAQKLVFVSRIDSPDNYYAIYESESGEKTLLVFETEEKTLKMLKYYNSEAFRAR